MRRLSLASGAGAPSGLSLRLDSPELDTNDANLDYERASDTRDEVEAEEEEEEDVDNPENGPDGEAFSPPSTVQSSRSQSPDGESTLSAAPQFEESEIASYFDRIVLYRLAPRCTYVRPKLSQDEPDAQPRYSHIDCLPNDVMRHVLDDLESVNDVKSFMLVQRSWLELGAAKLWYKPQLTSQEQLNDIVKVLSDYRDHMAEKLLDVTPLVHRLNFSLVARHVTDQTLRPFTQCRNVDRLGLANCTRVKPHILCQLVTNMPQLVSLDLQGVPSVTDELIKEVAEHCPDLQVFYGGGDSVTDAGLLQLSRICHSLRRLRLAGSPCVTPKGVMELVVRCPNLVELDVSGLLSFGSESENFLNREPGFSNFELGEIISKCIGLRELRIDGSRSITLGAFTRMRHLRSVSRLESLRVLSLAMCSQLTDAAIAQITVVAPRLRHLMLSKCPLITDKSLNSIAMAYGQALHYLHLGHCAKITDRGVSRIAEMCIRLSFFDAANCTNLTSRTLVALSRLPRLRRIGVVKCGDISDAGVLALAHAFRESQSPAERLHLSYCSSISLRAIRDLLNSCPRIVHLSLTGVRQFMRDDVMRLSRPPPGELNEHQRQVFCVFSGSRVHELRVLLNRILGEPALLYPFARGPLPDDEMDEGGIQESLQDWVSNPEELQRRMNLLAITETPGQPLHFFADPAVHAEPRREQQSEISIELLDQGFQAEEETIPDGLPTEIPARAARSLFFDLLNRRPNPVSRPSGSMELNASDANPDEGSIS